MTFSKSVLYPPSPQPLRHPWGIFCLRIFTKQVTIKYYKKKTLKHPQTIKNNPKHFWNMFKPHPLLSSFSKCPNRKLKKYPKTFGVGLTPPPFEEKNFVLHVLFTSCMSDSWSSRFQSVVFARVSWEGSHPRGFT